MSLSYCSLHERLFDPQCNTWVTWSQMYVDMVKPFCDILDSANIDSSAYAILPTPCDLCKKIARQAVSEQIEPFGPL